MRVGYQAQTGLDVVEAIAVLSKPEEPETVADRIRAGEQIRDLAPGLWGLAQPILINVMSAEVLQGLHLH
jgi:hypothetical protein